nr:MAG TPA: hypothetical protein [Caudoviricetes sp.]
MICIKVKLNLSQQRYINFQYNNNENYLFSIIYFSYY